MTSVTKVRFDNPDVILTDVIASHGRWRTEKPAIICDGRMLTWGEFDRRVSRVAAGLMGRGHEKGDKASILMSNCLEMPEIIFGVIRAGGVIVPLSALVTGESLARMINDSDSKFLFTKKDLVPVVSPYLEEFENIPPRSRLIVGGEADDWVAYSDFIENSPESHPPLELRYQDPMNIMYTSGTTGAPKGILHTHHNRTHFALSFGLDYRLDSSAVTVITTSLYANGTWLVFLPTIFAGGTMVIMTKFSPKEFMALAQEHRASHTFMVPTQYVLLMEEPERETYDLGSMRIWNTAGSPMRTQTKEAVINELPGELLELWGLTEGVATTIKQPEMPGKMESVGLPLVGWEVGIIDDDGNLLPRGQTGEIIAHSAFLMPEYYKLPEKTKEAIWLDADGKTYLRTGDMGKLDEDGYLYILDRKKDMIISGGINIFATDMEEVISRHPAVRDVAVIGVPHEKWGETPWAIIIPRAGSPADPAEIQAWANERMAKYQRLGSVKFFPEEDFPRNALGKVLKRELREAYGSD